VVVLSIVPIVMTILMVIEIVSLESSIVLMATEVTTISFAEMAPMLVRPPYPPPSDE
jgi:hypothetical protein